MRRAGVDAETVLHFVPASAHALAALAVTIELLARGARVACVAAGLGLPVSLATSVRAQLAGDALGAVTPSRVGSDPAKLSVLRSGGVGIGAAGALVLAEMAAEVLVLVIAALAILALRPALWWVALGVGGYAVAVSAAWMAAIGVTRWAAPSLEPPRGWRRLRLSERRWRDLFRLAHAFHLHARALRRVPARFAAAALAAGALHLAARLALLPALMSAAGATGLGFSDLVLRPFFVLYATALLPPPGGGGGVEVAFAAALGGALPPAHLAAALVWWRIYTFYLSALIGWLYLGVSNLRLHKMLDTTS